MKRMLFNARQAEELRMAIVDGQTLLDLDIETLGKEQRKSNVYTGIITRIEPSLEACFVDYGTDRHGFLPFKEVSRTYFRDYHGGKTRIQDVLKEGMQLIVQVVKDERGNKGAALTTFISLAGRYLVLMPNNPHGGGVSRRIEGEERAELKEAMSQLNIPNGMSIIARTAGIGRSTEELNWDLNYLLRLWKAIESAAAAHKQPYLLFMESSLVIRAIRDYYRPDISEILIDNPEVYEQVSEFMSYVMPNHLSRLKLYNDHTPLFSRLQIEQQIESAFARSVSLPSGGAIVIDHTEALVSIDVNSARSTRGADIEETAFRTNMEAAEEVARQMRLRDLGGLVVIDFIDMEDSRHQREIENTLRESLKKDRARVQMGKLSRFGLLELSRQRLQPALAESSHTACPRCAGTGSIRSIESTALHVLRLIQDAAMKENTGEVHAQVPVDVATFLLNEKRAELFSMEERLDVSVFLIPNIHLENPHYEINRIHIDNVEDNPSPSHTRVAPPKHENTLPFSNSQGEKATRPEPAVRGLKHASPAPSNAKEKQAWIDRLLNWVSSFFSGSPKETKPQNKTNTPSNNRVSNKRNHPNRRTNTQKRREENNTPKPENTPKIKAQTPDKTVQNSEPNNHIANTREQKNPRRRNQANTPNKTAQLSPKPTVPADELVSTHVEQTYKTEPQNQQNQRKNKAVVVHLGAPEKRTRNNRNRHQEKRRSIPSAVKMEQNLNMPLLIEKVRLGIAHVLAQDPDFSAQNQEDKHETLMLSEDMPSFAPNEYDEHQMVIQAAECVNQAILHVLPDAIEPEISPVSQTQTLPEECEILPENQVDNIDDSKTVPIHKPTPAQESLPFDRRSIAKLAQSLDLGDLQFVETHAGALIAAAARLEPKPAPCLRHNDRPKNETALPDVEMIQIETRF